MLIAWDIAGDTCSVEEELPTSPDGMIKRELFYRCSNRLEDCVAVMFWMKPDVVARCLGCCVFIFCLSAEGEAERFRVGKEVREACVGKLAGDRLE